MASSAESLEAVARQLLRTGVEEVVIKLRIVGDQPLQR
jgi:hypothetical protein